MEKKTGRKKPDKILAAQVLTIIALLVLMQVSVDRGWILKIFMASPTSIVEEGINLITSGELWPNFSVTMAELLTGYAIEIVVGVTVGLFWIIFPPLEKYMSIFCSAVMAVPKTAILPLLIIWFGIGFSSKVVLVILFGIFTILYNTVTAAKQCRTEYLKVARAFQASRLQTVFYVIIPSALPGIFNGIKLAGATALTSVVFSEMQAAKAGLGFMLYEAQQLLDTPKMFFVIILVTLISVCITRIAALAEWVITRH